MVETAVVSLCNDDADNGNERGDGDGGAGSDRSGDNQRSKDNYVDMGKDVNDAKWNEKRLEMGLKQLWNVWMHLLSSLCDMVDKKSWAVTISKIGPLTKFEKLKWSSIIGSDPIPLVTDVVIVSIEHNPYLQISPNNTLYHNYALMFPKGCEFTHSSTLSHELALPSSSVWVVSHVSTLAKHARPDGIPNNFGRRECDYGDDFVGVKIGLSQSPVRPPSTPMCPTIYSVCCFLEFLSVEAFQF